MKAINYWQGLITLVHQTMIDDKKLIISTNYGNESVSWTTELIKGTTSFAAAPTSNTTAIIVCDGYNWGALLLPLLIVWGLTGNLLVCIAIYTDRRLQNVTNYFLFSLAVCDLLVCCLVMPLSILVEFRNGHWHEGVELCLAYTMGDVFLCSASIVHMSVISLDRYMGICCPLKPRNKSKLIVVFKIVLVWVTTCLISSPIAVLAFTNPGNIQQSSHCEIFNHWFKIYGSTLTFLIPMGIMIVTYHKTTKLLMHQSQLLGSNNPNQQSGLRRAGKTSIASKKSSKRISGASTSTDYGNAYENRRATEPLTQPLGAPKEGRNSNKNIKENRSFSYAPTVFKKKRGGSTRRAPHRSSSERRGSDQDRVSALMDMRQNDSRAPSDIDSDISSGEDDRRFLSQLRSKVKRTTMSFLHIRKNSSDVQEVANEQKATRVLGVVFTTFFVCWTPFFALNFTLAFCALLGGTCNVPPQMSSTFLWLGYISSTINPLIYTVFNKRFREAFSRLIRCHCSKSKAANPAYMSNFSNGCVISGAGTGAYISHHNLNDKKISVHFGAKGAVLDDVTEGPSNRIINRYRAPSTPIIATKEVQLSDSVLEFQTTC